MPEPNAKLTLPQKDIVALLKSGHKIVNVYHHGFDQQPISHLIFGCCYTRDPGGRFTRTSPAVLRALFRKGVIELESGTRFELVYGLKQDLGKP